MSPGHQREIERRLVEAALDSFAFVSSEYGLSRSASDGSAVVFESDAVRLTVTHHRGEIDARFHRLDQAYPGGRGLSLSDIIRTLDPASAPPGLMARNDNVERVVDMLAERVRRCAVSLLKGDEHAFERLLEGQQNAAARHTRDIQLQSARSHAGAAWEARDYRAVVDAFEPMRADLSPAEYRKLAFAKKQLGPE